MSDIAQRVKEIVVEHLGVHSDRVTDIPVNRRGIFTPDRRAIETPFVDGVERVGDRSCAA